MQVALFLAADYANLTGDGKLNIMGIFSTIFASQFPARHPSMHVVAKLIGELGEDGQTRQLRILLMGPDGERVLDFNGEMQVPQRINAQKPEINAIINLRDIVFPVPGPYQFALFVDKDHKSELPLYVQHLILPAPPEK